MKMDTANRIAERLFSRTSQGIKLGLKRMQSAADRLDNPQETYSSLHVAGTNGKGSVCTYLESCLRTMGFKTGLFTSPHIVDFEERFTVGGKTVSGARWVDVYRDLQPTIDELELTFFEASTLIAFELFKREDVEWAVFETGLGGRLDATNILFPNVSVVTRIAMDHMMYLGDDLLSIAREKLGIVKRGVPLVMTEPDDRNIRKLAMDRCLHKGSQCQFVSQTQAGDIRYAVERPSFVYRDRRFEVPFAGRYQVENALIAIRALLAAGFTDMDVIARGIRSAFIAGRFQIVQSDGKTIIFDVGHNPNAAQSFAETLAMLFPDSTVCLVTGIMKDKDASGMFAWYCKRASRIILTRPNVERSAETAILRSNIPAWFSGEVCEIQRVSGAVEKAFESPEKVVCVVGSFYTVGEAMKKIGISPYRNT
jgi:dihydrofolate synthase/folylpolyglutamate synthase